MSTVMHVSRKRLEEAFRAPRITGRGESIESGGCIEEFVSYIAGEPWSDQPMCSCPVIAAFCRAYWDHTDPAGRDAMMPFVVRQIGTVDDGYQAERAYLVADWAIRIVAPALLDNAGYTNQAHVLRALPAITHSAAATAACTAATTARNIAVADACVATAEAVDTLRRRNRTAAAAAAVAADNAAYAASSAAVATVALTAVARAAAASSYDAGADCASLQLSMVGVLDRIVSLGERDREVVIA